jgi:hypothetical protein
LGWIHLSWKVVLYKIEKQSEERGENIKLARSNWHCIQVFNLISLKNLIEMTEVLEDGKAIIDWVEYQSVTISTPKEQLWGMSWKTVLKKIRDQGADWTSKFGMKGNLSGKIVSIYDRNALKSILSSIWLSELWEDGKIIIDWVEYQVAWKNSNILVEYNITYSWFLSSIKSMPTEDKDKFIKKASEYPAALLRLGWMRTTNEECALKISY